MACYRPVRTAISRTFFRETRQGRDRDMNNKASVSFDSGHDLSSQPRHDWTRSETETLYDLPFVDLIFQAQTIHRRNFDPNHVETASLLSIKTGGCPEDC